MAPHLVQHLLRFMLVCALLGACGDKVESLESTQTIEGSGTNESFAPTDILNVPNVESDPETPVEAGPQTLPIVLLHGMAGFVNLGPLEYWWGIIEALDAQGFAAYPLEVDPFQTMSQRGFQAAAQIDAILE